ncbi:hypothetical protein EYF80_037661 [Liparis tanakae]|uniref:Uncharacterized protein n=1 Tax=Liparis tanakae TaxID=230148 RepID=A0A4Z2GHH7_9TELE|nr:hypothetical protein EYF80_037661 [Liparis tanakae]
MKKHDPTLLSRIAAIRSSRLATRGVAGFRPFFGFPRVSALSFSSAPFLSVFDSVSLRSDGVFVAVATPSRRSTIAEIFLVGGARDAGGGGAGGGFPFWVSTVLGDGDVSFGEPGSRPAGAGGPRSRSSFCRSLRCRFRSWLRVRMPVAAILGPGRVVFSRSSCTISISAFPPHTCLWLWKRSSASARLCRSAASSASTPRPDRKLDSTFRLRTERFSRSISDTASATRSSARVLARLKTRTWVLLRRASAKRSKVSWVMSSRLLRFTSLTAGSSSRIRSRVSATAVGFPAVAAAVASGFPAVVPVLLDSPGGLFFWGPWLLVPAASLHSTLLRGGVRRLAPGVGPRFPSAAVGPSLLSETTRQKSPLGVLVVWSPVGVLVVWSPVGVLVVWSRCLRPGATVSSSSLSSSCSSSGVSAASSSSTSSWNPEILMVLVLECEPSERPASGRSAAPWGGDTGERYAPAWSCCRRQGNAFSPQRTPGLSRLRSRLHRNAARENKAAIGHPGSHGKTVESVTML